MQVTSHRELAALVKHTNVLILINEWLQLHRTYQWRYPPKHTEPASFEHANGCIIQDLWLQPQPNNPMALSACMWLL